MERAARERAEDEEKARQLDERRSALMGSQEQEGGGFFSAMKRTMPKQCETSYDCERPEVCCDLLFGTVCCSGGMMIPTVDGPQMGLQRQGAMIPIPVEADRPNPLPLQGQQEL